MSRALFALSALLLVCACLPACEPFVPPSAPSAEQRAPVDAWRDSQVALCRQVDPSARLVCAMAVWTEHERLHRRLTKRGTVVVPADRKEGFHAR